MVASYASVHFVRLFICLLCWWWLIVTFCVFCGGMSASGVNWRIKTSARCIICIASFLDQFRFVEQTCPHSCSPLDCSQSQSLVSWAPRAPSAHPNVSNFSFRRPWSVFLVCFAFVSSCFFTCVSMAALYIAEWRRKLRVFITRIKQLRDDTRGL